MSRTLGNLGISHGNVGDIPMKFDIPRLPRENQRYSWVLGDWVISFFGTHNLKRYPPWPESKLPFVNLARSNRVNNFEIQRRKQSSFVKHQSFCENHPLFGFCIQMRGNFFKEILKLVFHSHRISTKNKHQPKIL